MPPAEGEETLFPSTATHASPSKVAGGEDGEATPLKGATTSPLERGKGDAQHHSVPASAAHARSGSGGGHGRSSRNGSRRGRGGDAAADADDGSGMAGFTLDTLVYSVNSFMAVLWPVAFTMILASLCTVYVSTASSRSQQAAGLSAYEVYDESETPDDSDGAKLGKSIINAIVIICFIAVATFGIVLLYRFRCMKLLIGYMMFSSMMLLGLMGGMVWYTALDRWQLPTDVFTYYWVLYNFSVVGVVSIFYGKGVPMIVTQGYLVATSVIMAWQLSRFEEWTGWSLLVCLALYDLCAVLTPCGPLKALVNLMQEYNEPMPGLLYEAELPRGGGASVNASSEMAPNGSAPEGGRGRQGEVESVPLTARSHTDESLERTTATNSKRRGARGGEEGGGAREGSGAGEEYQLQQMQRPQEARQEEGGDVTGRQDQIGDDGFNYAEHAFDEEDEEEEEEENSSIKLGLGDLVFYSVLCSKAAIYGFVPWAACFLVILGGLGATLTLLGIYKKALPALPISIFLGVMFYLLTRFAVQPYMEALAAKPLYI